LRRAPERVAGLCVMSTNAGAPRTATGDLRVGAASEGTEPGRFFPGSMDDVWAFQGALNDSQVERLATSFFDVPTEVPPVDG
ncbi:hypothetical protein, partial [Streptomyces sp. NPDC048845]|uniref:hypothetical protein n=1 Tax=Streptomyces sp. NPDC048845 TaxID=3155390 RepID=UPI0034315E70